MRMQFMGAACNVTGSCYVIENAGKRLVIDCGYYQERDYQYRNWDPFPVDPKTVDAVILTHAHLDHCGLLPKFVRDGFQGPIYCTGATKEIAAIVMLDSAKIQVEDAKYKQRRHEKEGRESPNPIVPLYTIEDAERVLPLFDAMPYDQAFEPLPGMSAVLRDAGHILGSATIHLTLAEDGTQRSIQFSGDLGRYDVPILRDPAPPQNADVVVVESTYGNRLHAPTEEVPRVLGRVISETHAAGGNVLIPSFAIERAQELLYHLSHLRANGDIPKMPIFLDSPMAVKVTKVFTKYPHVFDNEAAERLRSGVNPYEFDGLKFCESVDDSKAINEVKSGAIIIAGSGMCTGGRIKHHLVHHIERPDSTILFVGYQARGTLGRVILEKTEEVRILGQPRQLKARVERVNGFSGHADRNELTHWLSGIDTAPRRVFTTHGESESATSFATHIQKTFGWRTNAPIYKTSVPLTGQA